MAVLYRAGECHNRAYGYNDRKEDEMQALLRSGDCIVDGMAAAI
jgi:hypothetical protein